ncbi:hypothetical protein A4U49_15365 [Acidithiobacillus ferrivorans]|nr:hypothetical protein A4U49_15365 [Acidithiobacillus ferrivorans]
MNGFVGRSGRMLHNLLVEHGLRRGYEYGCANLVRYWPEGNRRPTTDETSNCLPYLAQTILRARPKALLLVGNTASQAFLGRGSL